MTECAETRSFCLLNDPWIPIAGLGEVSLTELFTHPEYARLGGSPIEKVVILRFLLCIAHASTPIPDVDAWSALTPEKLAENALEYLEKWKDRFDLYDEKRPFLQFPQLRDIEKLEKNSSEWWPLSINGMQNNTILTQMDYATDYTESEKVRLLLSGVCYSCRRKGTKALISYSLMGEGNGFLHSFLLGESIIQTIYLNMLTDEEISGVGIFDKEGLGKPFWEWDFSNNDWIESYKNSYIGCLFPINKFLYIMGDKIVREEGIVYPEFLEGQWDPGITIFKKDNDRKALYCSTEKLPWRSLGAIFEYSRENYSNAFLRYGLEHLRNNTFIKSYGLWCGGVEVNTATSKNQKISGRKGYIESEFQIQKVETQKSWWCKYKELIQELSEFADELDLKVKLYYKKMSDPAKNSEKSKNKWSPICKAKGSEAKRLFWERMERMAQEVIDLSVETEQDIVNSAKRKWQEVALSCYREICPCITPRQMQAYVQCMPTFKKKEGKK